MTDRFAGDRFAVGDRVQVRAAFPPGHVRTPHYLRGKNGDVVSIAGRFANPEELAYGRDGEPCRRCRAPITKTRVGGRGTWFCPRCQPLPA